MKKIYSLCMALCLSVLMLNAKTVETTLWEGVYAGEIELNAATIATFKAGDILRIYVAASKDGGNFKLVYKGEANDWTETAIPSVNSTWPWINGGEDRFEVTFTAADIAAIASMNIYIANGGRSIVKVSLITEEKDMKETTLWEGEYTGEIELNAATVATFKADDILRIYVAASADGGNFKLVYKGEANDWTETAIPSVNNTWPWINGGEDRFEVTFTAADIAAIASMNIYIANGGRSIVKVSLLTEDQGGSTGLGDVQGDKVQGTKVIENGILYILYNGAKYNVQGQMIK